MLNYVGKWICGKGYFFLIFLMCGLVEMFFKWVLGCYFMLVMWSVLCGFFVEKIYYVWV